MRLLDQDKLEAILQSRALPAAKRKYRPASRENVVLNPAESLFDEYPTRYWELDETGQPTPTDNFSQRRKERKEKHS
jgi:hypothetical protein